MAADGLLGHTKMATNLLIDKMFGSSLYCGVFGMANLMVQLLNFKNPRWRPTVILDLQNGHNFTTGLTIEVMFEFRAGFRGRPMKQ